VFLAATNANLVAAKNVRHDSGNVCFFEVPQGRIPKKLFFSNESVVIHFGQNYRTFISVSQKKYFERLCQMT
jgi:hypothetical protein